MSTTVFEKKKTPAEVSNPLGIKGIDHIEFIVDDANNWRDYFMNNFGMAPRAYADEKSRPGRRAHVVGQGRINFLIAEPAGKGDDADELREHIEKHGNGVKDVAFRVADARKALEEADARGATVVHGLFERNGFRAGSIAAYGDTIHTFNRAQRPRVCARIQKRRGRNGRRRHQFRHGRSRGCERGANG